MAVAYVDRAGVIHIGPACHPKCLPLASGPESVLQEAIEGIARLAYDNATWLVPGIPEADDEDAAYDAAVCFERNLQARIRRLEARSS